MQWGVGSAQGGRQVKDAKRDILFIISLLYTFKSNLNIQ